jgi:hypothetical protein
VPVDDSDPHPEIKVMLQSIAIVGLLRQSK